MNNGFTFNGIKKPYITTAKKSRPVFAPLKRNLRYIPGMPGAYLESTDTEIRIQPVTVWVDSETYPSLQKLKEDMAAWLVTDQVAELVFDDELDRIYYAAVDGTLDLDELVSVGHGVITFVCPDPFKYGIEKEIELNSTSTFFVEGSKEAEPVISCTISQDTTYVAVMNGEEINMIGSAVKQSETIFEPETAIMKYSANNLTGWTNSSSASIEGAEQAGSLKTDGENLYTDDYGTGVGWHGPAMKTSLSSPVQDFRLDVGFNMKTTGKNQAGSMNVNLLDANNSIVATIAMTKHFGGLDAYYGRVKAGNSANDHDVLQEAWASYARGFEGVMRLWRRGNYWTAQVFYMVKGVFLSPITHSWTDTEGIAISPIAQVQARLLQRADFPVVEQKIADINVYRLNDPAAGQVPIIARAGDVVVFDHVNDIIRLNGEDITREKVFIGDYFTLKPGENSIFAEPSNAISETKVRWHDRWL